MNTHKEQRSLLLSSAVFTSMLTIWPVMAALSIPERTLNEQIFFMKGSFLLDGFNFAFALFISPALDVLLALSSNCRHTAKALAQHDYLL